MKKTPPNDCVFALKPNHAVFTDYPARKLIKAISYSDIHSWGNS